MSFSRSSCLHKSDKTCAVQSIGCTSSQPCLHCRLVRFASKKDKTDTSPDDEKDVDTDQDVESQELFSDAVSSGKYHDFTALQAFTAGPV